MATERSGRPHRHRTRWWVALCACLIACTSDASTEEVELSTFEPGQVWTYETRPGEESSRVVVCRIDQNDTLGPIVHVYIEEVAIPNAAAPGGLTTFVGHMPIAEASLRECVVALVSTRSPLPAYEEGYETWKQAFESGEGGIFTISIGEAVDFMQEALNR